jgi:hypothetical protein
MTYYDSMGGGCSRKYFKAIKKYLKNEFSQRGETLHFSGWTMKPEGEPELPLQLNAYDCGVFLCRVRGGMLSVDRLTFWIMPWFSARCRPQFVCRRVQSPIRLARGVKFWIRRAFASTAVLRSCHWSLVGSLAAVRRRWGAQTANGGCGDERAHTLWRSKVDLFDAELVLFCVMTQYEGNILGISQTKHWGEEVAQCVMK